MSKTIGMGGNSQGRGPSIDLNSTTGLECESCGHLYFREAVHIRKVSALLTGTGQPGYMPIPVFECTKCGHVNSEFLPKELTDIEKDGSDGEIIG